MVHAHRIDMPQGQSQFPENLAPNAIHAWLASLQLTNVRESSRVVYPALKLINEAPPEHLLGWDELEAVRPVVFLLSKSVIQSVLGKPLPLDPATRKQAKLSVAFHIELAKCYVRFLTQSSHTPEVAATAAQRSLQSMAHALLRNAQLGEAPSHSIWERMNRLMPLLEQWNAAELPVDDPEAGTPTPWSACRTYLRAVLFIAAIPNRSESTDIARLFDLVGRLSSSARLVGPGVESLPVEPYWQVDWESDHPPQIGRPDAATSRLRLIALDPAPTRDLSTAERKLIRRLLPPDSPPLTETPMDCMYCAGFDEIWSALGNRSVGRPHPSMVNSSLAWGDSQNLELLPLADQRNQVGFETVVLSSAPSSDPLRHPCKLWLESHSNWGVGVTDPRAPTPGTLIALATHLGGFSVAIVRGRVESGHKARLSLELLPSGLKPAQAIFEQSRKEGLRPVILSQRRPDDPSTWTVVAKGPRIQLGSLALLTLGPEIQEQSCRISRVYEIGDGWGHYGLSAVSEREGTES